MIIFFSLQFMNHDTQFSGLGITTPPKPISGLGAHVSFWRINFLPERSADVSGEQAVYDGVGSGIQWCQTLYKRSQRYVRLRFRYVPVHLKQVKNDVRAPAQDEHCKTKCW